MHGTGASGVRGAVAFADSANATDFVYIHDNFIDNYSDGFQFVVDKHIWVKNNILINVTNLLKSDSTGHGTFEGNYQVTVNS
jgi:hypothetical protein